ncbi:MAG TPA: alkaline phosphatase family protein [Actinomycetota bacterium]|nr:alkaline phosphatase family protein [Actinomycetota bacterium]
MTRVRRLLIGALLATSAACSSTPSTSKENSATPTFLGTSPTSPAGTSRFLERLACRLPRDQLLRTWRGYHPQRSADLLLIAKEPNVLGTWFPHSGPWDYLQRVPMFWYGPGQVSGRGRVGPRVTMADVAPTMAEYLGFDFDAPDGAPMREALRSEARPQAPRLIVVMVWDGGGRNVLSEHPRDWPVLRSLIPKGVWYENAEVGSSPSLTPAVHTTLGTGAFPRRHGVVDARLEFRGKLARPESTWPEVLPLPTLADLYDRALGNRPLVGVVAALNWHLGMAGHGSFLHGGDRDIVALQLKTNWGVRGDIAKFFRAPSYVTSMAGFDEIRARIDREDGVIDDSWFANRFVDGSNVLLKKTTIEWQTRLIDKIVTREGFGDDRVPDLLFVNYKEIDTVSHSASMNSPDMGAMVRGTDAALEDLIALLNREVGRGRWVLLVTADHGATPHPKASGGLFMQPKVVADDLRAAVDDDDGRRLALVTRPTQMWIDTEELRSGGFTLRDAARFLSLYTKGQYVANPAKLSAAERQERLFSVAIPGPLLERLPCLPRS